MHFCGSARALPISRLFSMLYASDSPALISQSGPPLTSHQWLLDISSGSLRYGVWLTPFGSNCKLQVALSHDASRPGGEGRPVTIGGPCPHEMESPEPRSNLLLKACLLPNVSASFEARYLRLGPWPFGSQIKPGLYVKQSLQKNSEAHKMWFCPADGQTDSSRMKLIALRSALRDRPELSHCCSPNRRRVWSDSPRIVMIWYWAAVQCHCRICWGQTYFFSARTC